MPSAKEVTIWTFWPHFSAKPRWVSGVRYSSCSALMLPESTGLTPIPFTKRIRFICTPGWSPSQLVSTTPAASARFFSSGPMVPSSSAFIRITCLPVAMAGSTA